MAGGDRKSRFGLPRIDVALRGRLILGGLAVLLGLAFLASVQSPLSRTQDPALQTARLVAAGQAYLLAPDGAEARALEEILAGLLADVRRATAAPAAPAAQRGGVRTSRPPRETAPGQSLLSQAEALAARVLEEAPKRPADRAARLQEFSGLALRLERQLAQRTSTTVPPFAAGLIAFALVGLGLLWLVVYRPLVRRLERTRQFVRRVQAHRASARKAIASADARADARLNLIAVVSHDVRTLLNGILGTASLLMGTKLGPAEADRVRTIESSGKSMLGVLNDLLDFSRVESGKMELERIDFSLRTLLDETAALWQSAAGSKGITFAVDYAQSVPDVLVGDPTRFKQVINNLISNAVKFTKAGSVRFIAEREQSGAGEVILRFQVQDTGIGMTDEARARVFEAYGQADATVAREFGGTGLGLAITRRLVNLMGGQIDLESAPGRGTTVTFTVPFALGDPSRVTQEESASLMPVMRPQATLPRVLVAEDHPVNQKIVVAMLASQGYEVEVVGTGKEAVERVQRFDYGLVLMDVQMPVMDGITATGEIRNLGGKFAELPIIALTANAMAGDRETYLEAGMSDYLSKPIDPIRLFGLIAKHCGLSEAPSAPPVAPRKGDDDRDADTAVPPPPAASGTDG